MISIRKDKNNIFYLKSNSEYITYDWVTLLEDGSFYFPLNGWTRQLFKRDILPRYFKHEIDMAQDDIVLIRDFQQNPRFKTSAIGVYPEDVTLLPHQEEAVNRICYYKKYGFFMGAGTGKTMIAICAMLTWDPESVLIVTPKSVMSQYDKECKKYLPERLYQRIKIINFESVTAEYAYDMLIVDEAHRAKSFTSDTCKTLRELGAVSRFAYLFTGTPQDKSRHEILPQLAILDNRVMPVKTKIYDRYFYKNDYYVPTSEKNSFSAELTWLIEQYTWGIKSEDALELPEEKTIKVMCDPPTNIYDTLVKDRVIRLPQYGIDVVADNKASLRIKLRELCAGHITGESTAEPGTQDTIRVKNNKVGKLITLIEKCPSAIIFTEFKEDNNIITDVFEKFIHDPTKTFAVLDNTKKKASQTIEDFKAGKLKFLIMNSKSGGTGLDLSVTNNIIFYTLPESYIVFTQAKARIRRYGQTQVCNYYYLLLKDSVEEQQYSALLKKKSFDNKLFKIYQK